MKIIIGSAVLLFLLALPVLATLTCEVRVGSCQAGYVDVFKMSNTTDAHAELRNETSYNVTACCRETYAPTSSLGAGCTGNYRILLNLSGNTNAHASLNNETGYSVAVCLSSTNNLTFAYNTSCAGYDTCIASISGNTNAHVGNCSAYSTLLCVQTRNMTVTITEGNGSKISTAGYQTQNLTVTFYDAALGTYTANVSGRIWVNGKNGFIGYDCTSNSNGNCTVKFDPDCSFAGGKTAWRGGVFGDDLYNDVNSSDGDITIDIEPTCIQTVTLQLELNISGSSSDTAEVDGNGTGFYRAGDIINYYSCIQDTSIGTTPTFGIVFSGSELNYINLTSGLQGGSFRTKLSQVQSKNRFVLPVTINGCNSVKNRMSSISGGILSQPFVAFVSLLRNPIEVILSYPDIDIIGDFSKSGIFTITLEKNETNRITQIIVRE